MIALVHLYPGTVFAWLLVAVLLLLQVLVADVVSVRRKHTPGAPIDGGHDDFLWRADRAHRNTNETLGAFVLLTLAAVAVEAHPVAVNGLALVYAAGRAAHMACYWADLRVPRSVSWVVALLALVGLAILVAIAI
ncbi:MAG: MAPEG family protein [Pseudomonadales bacterium]|nr:MAPEG family protein [Pseudomonadales bacterium]